MDGEAVDHLAIPLLDDGREHVVRILMAPRPK
jgi:hypothetical protein